MKLHNEFTVGAPLERTWRLLLDIERVAGCLPGATIEPTDEDGVYRGTMRVKLGPVTTDYRGTARLQDVDEDTHSASIAVEAREARGQGTAAATIRNSLEPAGEATRVAAETDLLVTGRQAQFGRGIMEDVASQMLGDFAQQLEHELATEPTERAPTGAGAGAPSDEALDIGAAIARSRTGRFGAIGVATALAVAMVLALVRWSRR